LPDVAEEDWGQEMRVAILGSGPTGLMSAAAALSATNDMTGGSLDIFSNNGKSSLYGAQYLHQPIPSYTNERWPEAKRVINYVTKGEVEDYRLKVYGPMWDGTVSPEDLDETHYAWDIRQTYDALWDDFKDHVTDIHMDPAGMRLLIDGRTKYGKYDLIINTIPRPLLCAEGHQFQGVNIWAAGEAPDLGIDLDRFHCPEFTVICNGEETPAWYRVSNIFGHKTVEWPQDKRPPFNAAYVTKPLKTNCLCWPEVLHVGRYGKWWKGILTHHAYQEVLEYVKTKA
jgi:hypothetical protein